MFYVIHHLYILDVHMKFPSYYFSPKITELSTKEVEKGHTWLYTDVTCPHCGKEQPVAMTRYVGGPCIRCGELTAINLED